LLKIVQSLVNACAIVEENKTEMNVWDSLHDLNVYEDEMDSFDVGSWGAGDAAIAGAS
jgi:hypothetical protein